MSNLPGCNRIEWVDIAKALSIWLMVFAHANLKSETLECMIYAFHMPVFFILSGYLDKGKAFSLSLLTRNIKSLIIPYFIYSFLGLSICWISPIAHPELYYGMDNLLDIYKAAIKGMFLMEDKVRPNSFMPIGCLWFLPALFLCKIVWSTILSCLNSRYPYWVIIPLGLALSAYYYHPVYFSVDSAAMGLPFYGLGYFFNRQNYIKFISPKKAICLVVAIIATLYLYYIGILNGKIDMNGGNPGNSIVMFYINAVIGSCACISIAKVLAPSIILQRVGAASLTILALHPFVIYASKAFVSYCLHADMSNFPIWGSALIACISCAFVVWLKGFINIRWMK